MTDYLTAAATAINRYTGKEEEMVHIINLCRPMFIIIARRFIEHTKSHYVFEYDDLTSSLTIVLLKFVQKYPKNVTGGLLYSVLYRRLIDILRVEHFDPRHNKPVFYREIDEKENPTYEDSTVQTIRSENFEEIAFRIRNLHIDSRRKDILSYLILQRYTISDIAKLFKVSNSVISLYFQQAFKQLQEQYEHTTVSYSWARSLSFRHIDDLLGFRNDAIFSDYQGGISVKQIVQKYKISDSSVYNVLLQKKDPFRPNTYMGKAAREARADRIASDYQNGIDVNTLAVRHSMTVQGIIFTLKNRKVYIPFRKRQPITFTCLQCGKVVTKEPEKHDQRKRFCCKNCASNYYHNRWEKKHGRKKSVS